MVKSNRPIGTKTTKGSITRRSRAGKFAARQANGYRSVTRTRPREEHAPRAASAATLFANILPEDETPDMLIDAVRTWRREGKDA
jgi:hypothetical protein